MPCARACDHFSSNIITFQPAAIQSKTPWGRKLPHLQGRLSTPRHLQPIVFVSCLLFNLKLHIFGEVNLIVCDFGEHILQFILVAVPLFSET